MPRVHKSVSIVVVKCPNDELCLLTITRAATNEISLPRHEMIPSDYEFYNALGVYNGCNIDTMDIYLGNNYLTSIWKKIKTVFYTGSDYSTAGTIYYAEPDMNFCQTVGTSHFSHASKVDLIPFNQLFKNEGDYSSILDMYQDMKHIITHCFKATFGNSDVLRVVNNLERYWQRFRGCTDDIGEIVGEPRIFIQSSNADYQQPDQEDNQDDQDDQQPDQDDQQPDQEDDQEDDQQSDQEDDFDYIEYGNSLDDFSNEKSLDLII